MRRLLLFVCSAVRHRRAYVDLDGTLLYRMRCPPTERERGYMDPLAWWHSNLTVRPIVRRRLVLCYALRLMGVRLTVWTNRYGVHQDVTVRSLGRHAWLFDRPIDYCSGMKDQVPLYGPVIEDQERYAALGKGHNLHVRQL